VVRRNCIDTELDGVFTTDEIIVFLAFHIFYSDEAFVNSNLYEREIVSLVFFLTDYFSKICTRRAGTPCTASARVQRYFVTRTAEWHKFRSYIKSRETQETRPSRILPFPYTRFKSMFFNLRILWLVPRAYPELIPSAPRDISIARWRTKIKSLQQI